MPYPPRQTPDSPVPLSMVPAAQTLHGTDLVVIVQTVNNPGEKTRTMTLSQLASFIGGGGLDSITFVGTGGYVTTVDGNGVKYHKNATAGDQAIRDYAIDTNGAHVSVITPNYTKKFETDGTKAVVTKTQQGLVDNVDLVDKVEVFDNYIQITHQTRVNNQVVTQTSKFGWDELKARYLRVMKDENNAIPLYWDNDNNEFVVWDRTNRNKVGLPKVHVHGTLEVEKDAAIRADVNITKTLTVGGRADFNGNFTVIKNLYATDYAEISCRLKAARLNLKNAKSYFAVSSNSDINTLIAGVSEQIAVEEGDIVTVHNESTSAVTVNLGTRQGGGGTETKSTTLNALCAMQFICCLKQTTQYATYVQWAPLGNATVTWA